MPSCPAGGGKRGGESRRGCGVEGGHWADTSHGLKGEEAGFKKSGRAKGRELVGGKWGATNPTDQRATAKRSLRRAVQAAWPPGTGKGGRGWGWGRHPAAQRTCGMPRAGHKGRWSGGEARGHGGAEGGSRAGAADACGGRTQKPRNCLRRQRAESTEHPRVFNALPGGAASVRVRAGRRAWVRG
jgi:hypothetical protein